MTDELKRKISEATKKAMANPELRKRLSEMKKGKIISPEHRAKIVEGLKKSYENRKSWNFGLKCPHSEETKIKIGLGNKGKTRSEETKQKISEIVTANPNMYWKGKKRPEVSQWLSSPEANRKKSEAQKGKPKPYLQGEKNWKWIKDRTLVMEKHRVRGSLEWKQWRETIFARDNFTCKDCGATSCYLEPHHIIPIRSDWSKLFNTNNGITLCRPCHKKTMWREEEFVEKYTDILTKAQ